MKAIFWRLVNALQALYLVFWTSAWILAALSVRLVTGHSRRPLMMAHYWARSLFWAGKLEIEVRGRENLDLKAASFYACNHQSMMDIPLMYSVLPVPLIFILKEELGRIPILGWYVRAMGMILVPRREKLRSVKNLELCRQRMKEGANILMFPEGTRSQDGSILPFKPGVFVPVLDLQARVVPVRIEGSGEVLPPGGFRVRPGKLRVTFGEAISTAGLSRDDRRELAERVRERIARLGAGH